MNINSKIEGFSLKKELKITCFVFCKSLYPIRFVMQKQPFLEVLLIKRDGFIILRVTDDGIGFDVDENKAGSYGMQNMYERAVEIGGTLKMVSLKNKGTGLK